jgi:hypothetical protein
MLDRQRIVTTGITTAAAATVALVVWLKPWATQDIKTPPPEPIALHNAHQIDIVFAVDTTGSMGGLLDGAKRTVWSIANQVRDLDKNADLHVGLVAYRDLGDDYVTKDFALTSDLDAMYANLTSFQADGGGDVPENVDAALYDAVHKMQWRPGAKKMIFLVGDAAPASRGEVPTFGVTANEAAHANITINTIRCGQDSDTARAWSQIAMIGNGAFSTIEQNGGVQQIATPYDDKMAQLAAEIDSTSIAYGTADMRRRYAEKSAAVAAAPAAAKADRGAYYAKGGAAPADDAVAQIATGAMNVEALDGAMLPDEWQGKSKEEIKAEVEARAKKREAAQKEMAELAGKRDEYIRSNAGKDANGFDAVVKKTLETQLK